MTVISGLIYTKLCMSLSLLPLRRGEINNIAQWKEVTHSQPQPSDI